MDEQRHYDRPPPIFFGWTRSFWATVAGIVLLLFSGPQEVLVSLGHVLETFTPWTADQVSSFLVKAAPAALWLFAVQQRSGAGRPYSTRPGDK